MVNTYGLSSEIFNHLTRCVDVYKEADSILDYLLNIAPTTYIIVDSYWHYVKQGGEDADDPYYTYGSYDAASEDFDEMGVFDGEIITELQFLCANGFKAAEFFKENAS